MGIENLEKIHQNLIMKKLLTIFIFICFNLPVAAQNYPCQEQTIAIEHLFVEKGAQTNQVTITNLRNIICKGNAFKVIFDCKLWSENAKAGQRVNFSIPEAIYTQEGTLIIPACSKIVGTIIKIQKQRIPNKNARVYINFDCLILADGTTIPMSGKPCTKDGALKEGPLMTAGKIAASTLGLGIAGAGAGVGFAFIPNPAKIGTGLAIGIPIGCSIGLITGLVTPGLKYHAKAGESITLILCENLSINKITLNVK